MKRLIHSNPRAQSDYVGSIPAVASTYDVYFYNDKLVEIVSRPKGANPTVLYVRDMESGQCFVAKSYQVIYKPCSY